MNSSGYNASFLDLEFVFQSCCFRRGRDASEPLFCARYGCRFMTMWLGLVTSITSSYRISLIGTGNSSYTIWSQLHIIVTNPKTLPVSTWDHCASKRFYLFMVHQHAQTCVWLIHQLLKYPSLFHYVHEDYQGWYRRATSSTFLSELENCSCWFVVFPPGIYTIFNEKHWKGQTLLFPAHAALTSLRESLAGGWMLVWERASFCWDPVVSTNISTGPPHQMSNVWVKLTVKAE